jgi:hypothetical protein
MGVRSERSRAYERAGLRERIGAGSGTQLAVRVLELLARQGPAESERLILELLRDLGRRARDLARQAERYHSKLAELIGTLDSELMPAVSGALIPLELRKPS